MNLAKQMSNSATDLIFIDNRSGLFNRTEESDLIFNWKL